MNRTLKQVRLNDSESRYIVRIEDVPSASKTQEARMRQYDLLKTLTSTPGLLDCGNLAFQSLKMWHDGEKWIIEMEATGA